MNKLLLSIVMAYALCQCACANQADDAQLVALWNKTREMRPKSFHFGPPFLKDPTFLSSVAELRQTIAKYSTSRSFNESAGGQFQGLVRDSCILSSISEWSDLSAASEGVNQWIKILNDHTELLPSDKAEIVFQIAAIHADNWIGSNPIYVSEFLEKIEQEFYPIASQSGKNSWRFQMNSYTNTLLAQTTQAQVSPDEFKALSDHAKRFLQSYWQDENVPLCQRTASLVRYTRALYAKGEVETASQLLDSWWQAHGKEIDSGEFFNIWFFVSWMGKPDVAKARTILAEATRRSEEGELKHNPRDLEPMVKAYYAKIFMTDYDLKVEAAQHFSRIREKAATSPIKQ